MLPSFAKLVLSTGADSEPAGGLLQYNKSTATRQLNKILLKRDSGYSKVLTPGHADDVGTNGWPPALHMAIEDDSRDLMVALILNGADVNRFHGPIGTPVLLAIWQRNLWALRVLIAAKANLEIPDAKGDTPVFKSIDYNLHEFLEVLITGGAQLKPKANGLTPLTYAIGLFYGTVADQYMVVEVLLRHGVNVNKMAVPVEDSSPIGFHEEHSDVPYELGHISPLIVAAHAGKPELIKLLLRHGAKINMKNNLGNTALCAAAEGADTLCAYLLLERGGDPFIKNKSGESAVSIAKKWNTQKYRLMNERKFIRENYEDELLRDVAKVNEGHLDYDQLLKTMQSMQGEPSTSGQ